MENLKKSEKNKNKLRAIYPKNYENFKKSKTRVQFYWFLLKKECSGSWSSFCSKDQILIIFIN